MDVEALFKQYYPRLRNYATRFVGNIFVAEDIVQECFIKLYEKRFSLAEVSPGALLFVMVRNSCLNYMKRKIFAVDGRNKNSEGMSAKELTQFLVKWFNPQYALNMDGGGSTTLCVEGEGDPQTHVVNYPCDNDLYDHAGERSRTTHFIIVAK